MTQSPNWIREDVVLALHERQLAEHGGPPGIRDRGLLESALSSPRNLLHYQGADLCDLAAAYPFSLAKNHPFVDGNKRTAYVCMRLFLVINGSDIEARREEKIDVMRKLAAGALERDRLAAWIREHLRQSGA